MTTSGVVVEAQTHLALQNNKPAQSVSKKKRKFVRAHVSRGGGAEAS